MLELGLVWFLKSLIHESYSLSMCFLSLDLNTNFGQIYINSYAQSS